MITAAELNPHNYPTTPEIDANLAILLNRMNQVRGAYDKPMIVTSGLRSQAQQDALIQAGKSNAPKSKHLTGQAVDISDRDGQLKTWVLLNIQLMIDIGFWFESFQTTTTWVHFQIVPPASGKRFFNP